MRSILSVSVALGLGCALMQPVRRAPAPKTEAGPQQQAETQGNQWESTAENQGLELRRFDLNRDRQPDVYKFFHVVDDPAQPGKKIERLVRKEVDINYDGKIDLIRAYDKSDQLEEERIDLDFDGKFDKVDFHRNGQLIRQEIDVNYDTKPDITKYFEGGKLSRIESDRDLNGVVEVWEYFENGSINRIGYDTNADGKVDVWDKKETVSAPVEENAAPAENTAAEKPAAETAPTNG